MITKPLNLRSHMQRPDLRFNSVPFLDICIIVLFFALANSRFVLAPGMGIDFGDLELPSANRELAVGRRTVGDFTMISLRQDNIVLFEGGRYALNRLERPLCSYVERNQLQGTVLLVKLDKSVPVQGLMELCELAHEAGFSGVQIAAREQLPRTEL